MIVQKQILPHHPRTAARPHYWRVCRKGSNVAAIFQNIIVVHWVICFAFFPAGYELLHNISWTSSHSQVVWNIYLELGYFWLVSFYLLILVSYIKFLDYFLFPSIFFSFHGDILNRHLIIYLVYKMSSKLKFKWCYIDANN